ncbi:unnamed protein product [Dimorphilus gyrociliatus]|uniref:C2H2-type domain-containing protein n=1 Tax=Dimorphilus gyrociliatus TaxID=2664684 RepID=A0A7I8VXX5_9ANNE|nr:unnamed protein product [Dimorphilus gyrociliatus]
MAEKAVFDCPMCDFRANSAFELDEHFSKVHDENAARVCIVCGLSFMNKKDLEFHTNAHFENDQAGAGKYCPICNKNLRNHEDLDSHVNNHFDETESESSIEIYKEPDDRDRGVGVAHVEFKKNSKQPSTSHSQEVASTSSGQSQSTLFDKESGKIYSNILNILREYLTAIKSDFKLCSSCYLFTNGPFDRGWSCGYRNLQMLLSSMMNSREFSNCEIFSNQFLQELTPIRKIQTLIERAWSLGFDTRGAQQLSHKLVNTKKWIGATEVVALLSSFRIQCTLIDVHCKSKTTGTHSHIFDWVQNYFNSPDAKFPLYLQHQGHSRTIVGIEHGQNGLNLLIFDPSCSKELCGRYCRGECNESITWKLFRRSLKTFFKEQYQIVAVKGIIKTEAEYERSKVLNSTLLPA